MRLFQHKIAWISLKLDCTRPWGILNMIACKPDRFWSGFSRDNAGIGANLWQSFFNSLLGCWASDSDFSHTLVYLDSVLTENDSSDETWMAGRLPKSLGIWNPAFRNRNAVGTLWTPILKRITVRIRAPLRIWTLLNYKHEKFSAFSSCNLWTSWFTSFSNNKSTIGISNFQVAPCQKKRSGYFRSFWAGYQE